MSAARINQRRPGLYRRPPVDRPLDDAARLDVEAGSSALSPLDRHVDTIDFASRFCAVNPVADRLPGGLFIGGCASNG
ncbi:hypothetical protein [Georhizobium profundi]|uniref:hypothetical protein n=1 Tax=Georhizobium profundi TaxID=2341112 RepID=UPI0013DEC94A|nr:hypothetical protein [Georhizobium profundi]